MQVRRFALLPFEVIVAATNGEVDAIHVVLKHYEAYIKALSTRHFYDENGIPYLRVDEEKQRMLEIELITKILRFQPYEIR